ncbi:unnamed protein product, partial [Mesorhabditis spiculigera]
MFEGFILTVFAFCVVSYGVYVCGSKKKPPPARATNLSRSEISSNPQLKSHSASERPAGALSLFTRLSHPHHDKPTQSEPTQSQRESQKETQPSSKADQSNRPVDKPKGHAKDGKEDDSESDRIPLLKAEYRSSSNLLRSRTSVDATQASQQDGKASHKSYGTEKGKDKRMKAPK